VASVSRARQKRCSFDGTGLILTTWNSRVTELRRMNAFLFLCLRSLCNAQHIIIMDIILKSAPLTTQALRRLLIRDLIIIGPVLHAGFF
jgi:hypothetical protein